MRIDNLVILQKRHISTLNCWIDHSQKQYILMVSLLASDKPYETLQCRKKCCNWITKTYSSSYFKGYFVLKFPIFHWGIDARTFAVNTNLRFCIRFFPSCRLSDNFNVSSNFVTSIEYYYFFQNVRNPESYTRRAMDMKSRSFSPATLEICGSISSQITTRRVVDSRFHFSQLKVPKIRLWQIYAEYVTD